MNAINHNYTLSFKSSVRFLNVFLKKSPMLTKAAFIDQNIVLHIN